MEAIEIQKRILDTNMSLSFQLYHSCTLENKMQFQRVAGGGGGTRNAPHLSFSFSFYSSKRTTESLVESSTSNSMKMRCGISFSSTKFRISSESPAIFPTNQIYRKSSTNNQKKAKKTFIQREREKEQAWKVVYINIASQMSPSPLNSEKEIKKNQ